MIKRQAGNITAKEADFQRRYEPNFAWKSACSVFQALPGLRGFWPMSGFDSGGDATDLGGLAHHLTYNGSPTYNYSGLAPYIDMVPGTADYLSHLDHADFDILGTETYIAGVAQGLTVGGWFWTDDNTITQGLFTKGNAAAATSSYELYLNNAGTPDLIFRVSTGAAYITSTLVSVFTQSAWSFCVGRFIPSTEVKVWFNSTPAIQLIGVPAALPNTAQPLIVGAFATPILHLDGRASMCFLCAAALPDSTILSIFEQTKPMYGVR